MRFALSKDTIMKEPISSYEDYCRVWAEVYKKHARLYGRSLLSCYVRAGIRTALGRSPQYPRPSRNITSDTDEIGLYIVRALVAQGMCERLIAEHTVTMQDYVDEAESLDIDPTDAMADGLRQLGVNTYNTSSIRIEHWDNRMRYLWAKHGGFDLVAAASKHRGLARA